MKQPEDIYTIDLAFKRKGELDMFAYFKTRDLILPDWVNYSQIIAVRREFPMVGRSTQVTTGVAGITGLQRSSQCWL